MRNRLPVYIEDRELPIDKFIEKVKDRDYSYGYVSVLYLSSIIITVVSVLTVIMVGK